MHKKRVNELRANAKKMKAWMGIPLILAVLFVLCLAVAAQENTADSWYQKGLKLMEDETYEDALIAFNKAIEMDPENASIWMGKGDTLVRMGDYNESQKIYEKSLEMADKTTRANPHDANGWFVQGELFIRIFKNDEAINAISRATELNPKYAEAWYLKGAALNQKAAKLPEQESIKTYEEAFTALNKAIELDPGYGMAWSEKGYTLLCLAMFNGKNFSRFNESLEAFDRAIELISDEDSRQFLALAWVGKALAFVGMSNMLNDMDRKDEARERYEEAITACDRVIELDPDFPGQEARLLKAGILSELGRYNESLVAYDEAISSVPADLVLLTAIFMADKSSVLIKMSEYEEALTTINAALEIDPTNPIAWKNKGEALNYTGRYEEAVSAYDKAVELSPELGLLKASSWQGKGDALKASGRQVEAAAAFAKAKELGYKA
jgi:tetratricopeptide (TPR) repeat protein